MLTTAILVNTLMLIISEKNVAATAFIWIPIALEEFFFHSLYLQVFQRHFINVYFDGHQTTIRARTVLKRFLVSCSVAPGNICNDV